MRFCFIIFIAISCMAIMLSGTAVNPALAENKQPDPPGTFNFPLLRDNGGHMRKLVENSFCLCAATDCHNRSGFGIPL